MSKVMLVYVLLVSVADGIRDKQMTSNVTQTLDYLLASNRYDKRLRPGFGGLEEFSMSWLFLDRVWKPDTYFVNGKRSYLHRITVPNKFLRLRHDGFITYSMRLTISASCPMYLRKFPLDTQRCPLVLGSYGYSNKDLIYKWTDANPIGLQEGVEIAQFDLSNVTTEEEKIMIKGGHPFSTVQANFWLKRHTGYFMLQVYVPCGLIVLSSWVSFWIDPDDVAARVALGVTTVLSLTTLGFGSRAQLPKVSYWTALDWFVIICFTSVFSVMIEYAIVNFIDKFTKDFTKIIQNARKEKAQLEESSKKLLEKEELSKSSIGVEADDYKPSNMMKNLQRKLSTAVIAHLATPLSRKRSKSFPNIIVEPEKTEDKTISPKIIVTPAAENLIDLETDLDAIEVVLDVEDEVVETPEQRDDSELQKPKVVKFFKNIKAPSELWNKWRVLPRETDIINLIESPDPPSKFSKIDVQSRRNFPIAFFLSLIVYLFAYSYYLTDDV